LEYYDFKKESFVTTDPTYTSEIIAEQGRIKKYTKSKAIPFYPWCENSWLSRIPGRYKRASVAKDKFGHYWISTGSQLFIFSIEDRFDQLLSGSSTRGIYQDGADLYVNTYLMGILKNGRPLIEKPSFAEGEIKKFGECLYVAWKGLIRYHLPSQNHEHLKFELNKNWPNSELRSTIPLTAKNLHQIRDTIWVGTNFGLGYIDKDSVVMISNFPNIEDLIYFEDGLLIAGISLIKHTYLTAPTHNLPKPACDNCRGIYIMQNKQLTKLEFPDLNYYQILEINEHYYFASDSGIVVWDGDKEISLITENEGLTDNRTCTMALDEHGFLWVSTFSGLNRINLSTGKINQYLNNVEFNYRSVFQNDSMIYMGGINGIKAFKPKEFIGDDIEPKPPLSIARIFILIGTGVILLMYFIVYFIRKYFKRKLLLKEVQLQETEKKLFLLQVEQTVLNGGMPLTVKSLADEMNLSERSLYRNFDKYNLRPGAFLKELRLKKAIYLLKDRNDIGTIREVAEKVGYTVPYLYKLIENKDAGNK
jgi:AraC-like DNA-binding protein